MAKNVKLLCLKKKTQKNEVLKPTETVYSSDLSTLSFLETPSSIEITENNYNKISYNSSVKISENPLDIFNGSLIKLEKSVEESTPLKPKRQATDEFILSSLKRTKSQETKPKNIEKRGIFSKLNIISNNEIDIFSKKYYKFPFDKSVINDESFIFNSLKEDYAIALSSVYSNYRRFGESFKVLFNDEIFDFSSGVFCSQSANRFLKMNDIKYTAIGEIIEIDQKDIGLLYDLLINIEIPKNKQIPFILSEFEFDNGMIFRVKLQKGPVVKNKGNIQYSYTLIGPFDSVDFSFDNDSILEYIK